MMKFAPCQIPELKLSCYGCCGNNFKTKIEVKKQIKENTLEFKKIQHSYSSLKQLQFRDRIKSYVTPSGVCQNLIEFENGIFACPLHKGINNIIPKTEFLKTIKKDLRENHCDQNYECETFIFWKLISQKQKEEYIQWLSKQKIEDHYEYSLKNHDGYYIKKFFDEFKYKIN